jgi:hypothetical protein
MSDKVELLKLLQTFFEVVIGFLEKREIENFVEHFHPKDKESLRDLKAIARQINEGSANVTVEQMIIDFKEDFANIQDKDIFQHNYERYGNSYYVKKRVGGYGYTEGSWYLCNFL